MTFKQTLVENLKLYPFVPRGFQEKHESSQIQEYCYGRNLDVLKDVTIPARS